MKKIRRRIIGGQYKPAKSRGSYTIDLNGQWQLSTTAPNPDPTMYEGVYESFKNRGIDYSADLMYIDVNGLTEFSFYVRSYAEGSYDFVVVSNLDCNLSSGTTSGTNVKLTTSGKQNSGTSISNYTLVEFSNIDGGAHRITVMYRKDTSVSNNDDRGYVLIPKLESSSEAHSYLTVEYQPTSQSETKLYEADLFDTTQLVSVEIDGVYYQELPNTFSFSDTSTTHTVRFGFHEDLTNCAHMFDHCVDITKIDASEWDSSRVTDMSKMFFYAGTNTTTGIQLNPSEWNVSNVRDMSCMFSYASLGTTDFSSWGNQVYNVTDMSEMFNGQSNSNITFGVWNCSNLRDMSEFFGDNTFTSLDLSNWNVSNVENMCEMFRGCTGLTSINLSGWDTRNVRNLENLFSNCKQLSQIQGISEWNVLNVTDMDYTFGYCNALSDTVLDSISNWDVHNVVTMSGLFASCSAITTTSALSNWDVSNVTNMSSLFDGCSGLTGVDALSNWDTNNVTNMSSMFSNCTSLSSCPQLQTSSVTNMSSMFSNTNILTLGMSKLQKYDFSKVTNFRGMFQRCPRITSINPLAKINTSSATDMSEMFANCTQLSSIGVVLKWDISNVTTMYSMFQGCSALKSVTELQLFDTSNVSNMGYMFEGCSALTSLSGLENWNTENVIHLEYSFRNCTNLLDVSPINNWFLHKVYCLSEMFSGCSKLQSISISSWDIDAEMDLFIDGIFKNCTNLTQARMELVFNRKPYRVATDLFSNVTTTGTLYYPASLQTKYEQYVIPYLPSTWTAIAQ